MVSSKCDWLPLMPLSVSKVVVVVMTRNNLSIRHKKKRQSVVDMKKICNAREEGASVGAGVGAGVGKQNHSIDKQSILRQERDGKPVFMLPFSCWFSFWFVVQLKKSTILKRTKLLKCEKNLRKSWLFLLNLLHFDVNCQLQLSAVFGSY